MNAESTPRAFAGVHAFRAAGLDGRDHGLDEYAGRVLLIVNTASLCLFTHQYAGLEALWRAEGERGFAVLGFPCNQFGRQEPGDSDAIRDFCSARFRVSFPLFARIDVNGARAHPLFQYLQRELPGIAGTRFLKWNFTKFLVDRDGRPLRRYGPLVHPALLRPRVRALLARTA